MKILSDQKQNKRGPELDVAGENIEHDVLLNQKRVPGMEFVGKRNGGLWNDRLGFGKGIILKRSPGMEFVGKRNYRRKFIRNKQQLEEHAWKRGPGMEFVGKRSSTANNYMDNIR